MTWLETIYSLCKRTELTEKEIVDIFDLTNLSEKELKNLSDMVSIFDALQAMNEVEMGNGHFLPIDLKAIIDKHTSR